MNDTQALTYHAKRFGQLTIDELYALLRVRNQVFVVEQSCPYQDLDNDDQTAIHVWITPEGNNEILALARVCPAGTHMKGISIGRVITTQRKKGYGLLVMKQAIQAAKDYFQAREIDIEAQCYAREFYEKLGFEQSSDIFDLDGIPHIKMTWHD